MDNLNSIKMENIVKEEFISDEHLDIPKQLQTQDLCNATSTTNTVGKEFCETNDVNSFATNCQRYPSTAAANSISLGYYSQNMQPQSQQQQFPQQPNYNFTSQQFGVNVNETAKTIVSSNNWISNDEHTENASTQLEFQQFQVMDQYQFGSYKV